jgi:hypothetical protein
MPMEQLQIAPFREALFRSRNAEEALLVCLNACSRVTEHISTIEHPEPTSFGTWFKRIQGQRAGPESVLAADCLSFLDLKGVVLYIVDFYNSSFRSSNLQGVQASLACFIESDFRKADMRNAYMANANLRGAHLEGAVLQGANLERANLEGANLEQANLKGANLEQANLKGANLEGANLEQAKLPAKAHVAHKIEKNSKPVG